MSKGESIQKPSRLFLFTLSVLFFSGYSLNAQQIISEKLTDKKDTALEGVTIGAMGTKKGTVPDVLLRKAEIIMRGGNPAIGGVYGNTGLAIINSIRTDPSGGLAHLVP